MKIWFDFEYTYNVYLFQTVFAYSDPPRDLTDTCSTPEQAPPPFTLQLRSYTRYPLPYMEGKIRISCPPE